LKPQNGSSAAMHRAPKITDPHSVALIANWVRAYLDGSRPTSAMLYKLMVASVTLEEERMSSGKLKTILRHAELTAPSFAAANGRWRRKAFPSLPVPSRNPFERAIRKLDSFDVDAAPRPCLRTPEA